MRLVAKLAATGVRPTRLRPALLRLRQFHPAITLTSLPASHIVTDGEHLYLRQDGDTLERLADGQLAFAFVIELPQLQREVAEALALIAA